MLRERLFDRGLCGFFTRDVELVRETRADRYGIRAVLSVDGAPLKLELVSEGRIALEGTADPDLPVARLTDTDLVAEKLLANADRFLDDSALARDALDLVVLAHELGELPAPAWECYSDDGGELRSTLWYQPTSCHRPNLRPTDRKTPMGSNPKLR